MLLRDVANVRKVDGKKYTSAVDAVHGFLFWYRGWRNNPHIKNTHKPFIRHLREKVGETLMCVVTKIKA